MATMKRANNSQTAQQQANRHDGSNKVSKFLDSPKAKWLFFSIYLIVTLFMFHEFIFSDTMLFGGDTVPDGIYTRKYYKEFHEEFGGVPRWNPYILGGLPFIDAMHGDTFYPGAWLKFFIPLERALGHKLIWHVLLAGIAMYIFLRILGNRREVSFLGGLMYMLAPSFVSLIYPGHDAKMYIIAWLPLAFSALECGMKKPSVSAFATLGGLMGLLVLTSHAQMAYYSYWALGLYFMFRLVTGEERNPKGLAIRSSLFVMAVVLAVLLGAMQLFPAYKFSTSQSVRTGSVRSTYEYATSWSMHQEEAMGMLVPSFQGNNYIDPRGGEFFNANSYWGKNAFKLNSEYHGILPILFAFLALLFARKKRTWFFFGLAIASLIYALGANTPFYRLFYAFVPGVKSFRAPGMIIFLFCFAIVAMAADFLSALLDRGGKLLEGDKRILYTGAAIAAVALVVTAMGESFFLSWAESFFRDMPDLKMQAMLRNMPFFVSDLWRVVIFACAALGGVYLFSLRKINGIALVALLSLITLIDQSVVNARFITTINPLTNQGIAPDASVAKLKAKLKSEGPFRIIDAVHSNNYYAMFGIPQVGGFHNNELKSYEEFRMGGGNNLFKYWYVDKIFIPEGFAKNNFLKVAGAKYLTNGSMLFKNEYALPRAFIVNDYVLVDDSSAAVSILADPNFDPSKTALIEAVEGDIPFPPTSNSIGNSNVRNLEYTKDGSVIQCSLSSQGLLIISDNFVPYWRAEIDGEETEIYRAFGTFMALSCPAGDHEIRFIYHSKPYATGRKLTLISLVLTVLLSLSSPLYGAVQKRKK